MTTVVLFHHALGRTAGFLEFADELRSAGHTVHTPDLYQGRTFTDLDEGIGHAEETGFDEVVRRGAQAADELPNDLVYAGFSLGVMPAQYLAQRRPGARGALLYLSAIPSSEFGSPWPGAVPLQIHMREDDPLAGEDLPAARALVEEAADGELFVYPGGGHLFADRDHADYDEPAARLLMERTLAFLDRAG
jgi:dienelactone hydrolase